jgi:hypothetical protein
MSENGDRGSSWLDFIALSVSFLGALVSIGGAVLILLDEASITMTPVWPLPGFVLLDWAVLGFIVFLATYLSFRQISAKWLLVAWFITGAFIPLIVLGALSIGLFVLITFLLFVISTIILAIRKRAKWLESFGLLMLGAVCNLGILLIMITLGNRSL